MTASLDDTVPADDDQELMPLAVTVKWRGLKVRLQIDLTETPDDLNETAASLARIAARALTDVLEDVGSGAPQ